MTRLVYNAGPGDPEEVTAFGVDFEDGKSIEVSDEVAEKLKGNPFFSVKAPRAAPTPPQAPAPAATAPGSTTSVSQGGKQQASNT